MFWYRILDHAIMIITSCKQCSDTVSLIGICPASSSSRGVSKMQKKALWNEGSLYIESPLWKAIIQKLYQDSLLKSFNLLPSLLSRKIFIVKFLCWCAHCSSLIRVWTNVDHKKIMIFFKKDIYFLRGIYKKKIIYLFKL